MILIAFYLYFIWNVSDTVTKDTEVNNDKDETGIKIFVVVYIHVPPAFFAP
jgi:hypothetical protein